MTGGQSQIDAETALATHVHVRLESLLRGTRTEECREQVIKAYKGYLGAQALVSICNKFDVFLLLSWGFFVLL